MTRLIFTLGLVVLLAACARPTEEPGGGPLKVSEHVALAFEKYKQEAIPVAFAVSIDGKAYNYFFCPGKPCVTKRANLKALNGCERSSQGVECRLLARGTQIIWNGPVEGLK